MTSDELNAEPETTAAIDAAQDSSGPSANPADANDSSAADLASSLLLSLVPGIGPRLTMALLERFGSPAAVLAAPMSELRHVPGIGAKLSQAISLAREQIDVAAELELCRENAIAILSPGHDEYPRVLREIHDPPAVLFVRGELKRQDGLAIAIVGTRHATQYGLGQAERLAGSLARAGLTIISGLARGIDAAAHRGALAAGGRTIAVLASGVLNIYPPEHQGLATEVTAQGAMLSEAPPRATAHERRVSPAEPADQRVVAGRDRRRGLEPFRRIDHRPARHGAGPRSVRRAGPGR